MFPFSVLAALNTEDYPSLGSWTSNQRRAYRLTKQSWTCSSHGKIEIELKRAHERKGLLSETQVAKLESIGSEALCLQDTVCIPTPALSHICVVGFVQQQQTLNVHGERGLQRFGSHL